MNLNINISVDGDWTDDPLAGLAALHEASKHLDAQIWIAVTQAKLAGHTWEQIGSAVGLSKQTVFDRYAPAVRNSEQAFKTFVSTTTHGEVVPGTVVSVTNFGVFVEVEPGLRGLVHSSETARPLDSFAIGEEVRVRFERLSLEKRRLAFSLN